MRRPELVLLGGFTAAMVAAALLGQWAGSRDDLEDPRLSTTLTGPAGGRALAELLERFDVRIERRTRTLLGVGYELRERDDRVALAILGPWLSLTEPEVAEVVDHVRQGGLVVLAGRSGVERALGLGIVAAHGGDDDSVTVPPPSGIEKLPALHWVLGRAAPVPGAAPRPRVVGEDSLLLAENRRLAAVRLAVQGGGRALMLADARWLTNRALRETDVGPLVLSWLLAERIETLVVDEYHQGFGRRGALFGAAWAWLRAHPAGWAMLQLAFAGLVALFAGAVRFGPALHAISRRRRSPIEHLDALAAGLERAGDTRTAVALLADGLRRRLRRTAQAGPVAGPPDRDRWLATLAHASDDEETRAAVTRLGWLLRESGGGDAHALRTAIAVEDVWDALKRPSRPARS